MKEKLIEILKVLSYFPRKGVDFFLYHFYLEKHNDWSVLNKFFQKSVLIVGNGPSLNKTPLDKINKNYVSIGMNKINLIYDRSSWRPDIIACVNGFVISQNKDYFNISKNILILPVKAFYLGIKPRKNILFVNLRDQNKIEKNIEKVLSTGCTVTFTALQIAAYLNPKEVSLVGVDHSFVVKKGSQVQKFLGDDVNHFDKNYFKGQYWGLPDLTRSEQLYQISKKYFRSNNIPIIDYTIDGKLEIFDKGNITDIIDK
jgi:hypothetical protein|tara:strand:- start:406 stop:1176 length:771 start_codon:yes stop_codon:yes gene_type:complete